MQTAAEISKSAMDNSDQIATEAVDLFLALIGAEAGHMGLRSLASGGIYICGGIMPKVMLCIVTGPVCMQSMHRPIGLCMQQMSKWARLLLYAEYVLAQLQKHSPGCGCVAS